MASLQQDSLDEDLRKTLIEDMANINNFSNEVDLILKPRTDYYAYLGKVVKALTIIIGLAVSISLIFTRFL